MDRSLAHLAALAVVVVACGGSSGAGETTVPSAASSTATTSPATVTSTAVTSTSSTVPPTTTTTTTPAPEPFVSPYSFGSQHPDSPVITPGEWDASFTAVPHVVVQDDGTWLMWYSGDGGRLVTSQVGLATSTDGVTWEKHPDNPVFTLEGSQGVGWLFVIDDGDEWRMIYTKDFGVGYRDVWSATAPRPEGPWTEEGQAFVAPATDCCKRILPTGFVKLGDTYWVPFAGFESGRLNPTVGFLTSTDGEDWVATEAPVHEGTAGSWDEFGVVPTNIIETENGLELFFLGFDRDVAINTDPSFNTIKMGRLVSSDGGSTWEVDNGGLPVVDTGELGWPGVTTVYRDGTYYFFLGDDLGASGIALITGTIP